MSLYVRLYTNFYTHRKTVKLKAILKSADAYWIPPRLWAYAAEHQADGDFSAYTSEELSEHLGCTKYATSILQAFKDSGFIDENGFIHHWEDHNEYHVNYKTRATDAANKRWAKYRSEKEKTGQDKTGQETSIASSIDKQCLEHKPSPLVLSETPTLEECRSYAVSVHCGFRPDRVEEWYHDQCASEWKYSRNWKAAMCRDRCRERWQAPSSTSAPLKKKVHAT